MTKYPLSMTGIIKFLGQVVIWMFLPVATVVALLLMMPHTLVGGLFYVVGLPAYLCSGFIGMLGALALVVSAHYLIISPQGIEYRRWPAKRITASWVEVEGVKKTGFLDRGKAILLIRRKKPGYEFKLGPWLLGSANYDRILLSDFTGWKDGRLKADINGYIPKYFVESHKKEDVFSSKR